MIVGWRKGNLAEIQFFFDKRSQNKQNGRNNKKGFAPLRSNVKSVSHASVPHLALSLAGTSRNQDKGEEEDQRETFPKIEAKIVPREQRQRQKQHWQRQIVQTRRIIGGKVNLPILLNLKKLLIITFHQIICLGPRTWHQRKVQWNNKMNTINRELYRRRKSQNSSSHGYLAT